MRAKIKATGEIIDVSQTESVITSRGVEKQYVDNNRDWCTYVQSELEFIKEPKRGIDWEQRRYEIAKELMKGFASNPHDMCVDADCNSLAEWSVKGADALIAELKKGGER